jgi:hypothetical protein
MNPPQLYAFVRVLSCRILLILLFFAQNEPYMSAGKRDNSNDWKMGLYARECSVA